METSTLEITCQNHKISSNILQEIGQSKGISDFYNVKYTPGCCALDTSDKNVSKEQITNFQNNLKLFEIVNGAVIGYKTGGENYFNEKDMPEVLKKSIIANCPKPQY